MKWNSTIGEVKECIGRKFDIPSRLLRLDHCSKLLEDSVEIHTLTAHEVLVLNVQRHGVGLLGGVKRSGTSFKCKKCSRMFEKYDSAMSHERQCTSFESSMGWDAITALLNQQSDGTPLLSQQSDGNDIVYQHTVDVEEDSLSFQESFTPDVTILEKSKSQQNTDIGLPLTGAHESQEEHLSKLQTVLGELIQETGGSDVRDLIQEAIDDEVITDHIVVTKNLMDDIRFRQVCLDHGLTNRAARDLISFIKTSESDLSTLRHPRTVMRKISKSYGNRQKWETRTIEMTGGEALGKDDNVWILNIDFRPLRDVVKDLLLSHATRANFHLHYKKPGRNGISEAYHADRFKRNQNFLFRDTPQPTDVPVHLLVFVDESHVDTNGHLKAYPVMLSLANFDKETIAKDTSKRVMMYIPVIDSSVAEHSKKEISVICRRIADVVWEIILKQIISIQETPMVLKLFGENKLFRIKTALYCIIQDTKEGNWISRHYQSWKCNMPCRVCDILFKNLLKAPYIGKIRTTEVEDNARKNGNRDELKYRSQHGGDCPFAKFSDALGDTLGFGLRIVCPPEKLHQFDGGDMKVHLWDPSIVLNLKIKISVFVKEHTNKCHRHL